MMRSWKCLIGMVTAADSTIITAILTEDLLQKAEALIAEDMRDHIGE